MEQNNKINYLLLAINIVAWIIMIIGGLVAVIGLVNFIEGGDVLDGLIGIPIFIVGVIILFLGLRFLKRKRF